MTWPHASDPDYEQKSVVSLAPSGAEHMATLVLCGYQFKCSLPGIDAATYRWWTVLTPEGQLLYGADGTHLNEVVSSVWHYHHKEGARHGVSTIPQRVTAAVTK